MHNYKRIYAKIDLDSILFNMESMKKNLKKETKMIAVIKTDGYGHGAIPIAKMLEHIEYVYGYAVATAEEAFLLRDNGILKPILILGYTFPEDYEMLIEHEISMAVFRKDTISQLVSAAKKIGKKARVHIKLDTGMGRIGIRPDEEGLSFVKELLSHKEIVVEGMFTHFAKADETDRVFTINQLSAYETFAGQIEEKLHYHIPVKHCSNSAGIIDYPQANMNVVRAGITVYGLWPSNEVSHNKIALKPALELKSTIVYIKDVPKGTAISYGGTYIADMPKKIATISAGYGDGYPRSLSGKGYVLIAGKKAPIVGRVCMDQFMVDVTDIPEAREDMEVTLIGKDGDAIITVEELAAFSGRFNYEFVCDLGKRIPRVFFQNGAKIGTQDYFHEKYLF